MEKAFAFVSTVNADHFISIVKFYLRLILRDPMQTITTDVSSSGEWQMNPSLKNAKAGNNLDPCNEELKEHEIMGVYRFMAPANPLEQRLMTQELPVKTALKLDFEKLPDFTSNILPYRIPIKLNENPQDCDDCDGDTQIREKSTKEKTKPAKINNTQLQNETDSELREKNAGKSLFSLYPEGDPRLVYRKFKSNTASGENRVYSSYLIDLQKLSKSNNAIIQYNQNDPDDISPVETISKKEESNLVFNSSFESGNLYAAFKLSENEYDLILQNDINTKGNTQWFFFSVSNTKKDASIKFNIVNLMKPDSLFNQGMQPVVYSTKENELHKEGWKRRGFNISYFKNHIMKECQASGSTYFTLTFSYTFAYEQDLVYLAHCFPYTYSDLNNYLNKMMSDPYASTYMTRKELCKTIAKNTCEYLTITSGKNVQSLTDRLGIVMTARQHPGESLSSYMMQGVIDFLCSREEEAIFLRETCVFKVIPMMNPDGVIHGNYRTGLAGFDLNRRWKKTNNSLFPTIHAAKELISNLASSRPLTAICDLHGHSRKKNSFFYGCTDEKDPAKSRLLPYILSKITSMFSFESSRFNIHKTKESTARVALWREYKIPNIFTLEASFFGYDTPEGITEAFTENDFMNIGKSLCKALYVYITHVKGVTAIVEIASSTEKMENNNTYYTQESESQTKEKISLNTKSLLSELRNNTRLLKYGDASDESGSDSNPSDDDLPKEHLVKVLPKTIYAKLSKKNEDDKPKIQTQMPSTTNKTAEAASSTSETKKISKLVPPANKNSNSKHRQERNALKGLIRNMLELDPVRKIFELVQDQKLNSLLLRKVEKNFRQEPQLYITANTFKTANQGYPRGKVSKQQPKKVADVNRSFIPQNSNQDSDPRKDTISPIEKTKQKGKEMRSTSENYEFVRRDYQERTNSPFIIKKRQSVSPDISKPALENKAIIGSQLLVPQTSEEHVSIDSNMANIGLEKKLDFKVGAVKFGQKSVSQNQKLLNQSFYRQEGAGGRMNQKPSPENMAVQTLPMASLLANSSPKNFPPINETSKQPGYELISLSKKASVVKSKVMSEGFPENLSKKPFSSAFRQPKALPQTRNTRVFRNRNYWHPVDPIKQNESRNNDKTLDGSHLFSDSNMVETNPPLKSEFQGEKLPSVHSPYTVHKAIRRPPKPSLNKSEIMLSSYFLASIDNSDYVPTPTPHKRNKSYAGNHDSLL